MVTDVKVDDQLTVGFVRGAHGLTGEFKLESTSGRYEHFVPLKEVTLRHKEVSKVFKVEYVDLGSSVCYMKLVGIDSPEEVSKYNRFEIRVPRALACPLEDSEWYVEDLKNCSLVYENNEGLADGSAPVVVGTITDVLEGGAGDLLEVSLSESCSILADDIKKTSSGKPRTVLVPFNEVHIGKVDIENRTVQLMHLWILE